MYDGRCECPLAAQTAVVGLGGLALREQTQPNEGGWVCHRDGGRPPHRKAQTQLISSPSELDYGPSAVGARGVWSNAHLSSAFTLLAQKGTWVQCWTRTKEYGRRLASAAAHLSQQVVCTCLGCSSIFISATHAASAGESEPSPPSAADAAAAVARRAIDAMELSRGITAEEFTAARQLVSACVKARVSPTRYAHRPTRLTPCTSGVGSVPGNARLGLHPFSDDCPPRSQVVGVRTRL